MRRIKKGPVPLRLAGLLINNPHATWGAVRKGKLRYAEIKSHLFSDQQSLCAYCEIRMIMDAGGGGSSDFRVEHFHPKSPHTSPPNYAAMWQNMLGCCHGGSQSSVTAPGRFTAPDLSCDALKADKNLVGVILNPITDIGDGDCIFNFSVDGSIAVLDALSPGVSVKAEETIRYLGLNSSRLQRLRREVIEAIFDAISDLTDVGVELEQACEVAFPDDYAPEFYSCIRSVLSPAAEKRLGALNYYQ